MIDLITGTPLAVRLVLDRWTIPPIALILLCLALAGVCRWLSKSRRDRNGAAAIAMAQAGRVKEALALLRESLDGEGRTSDRLNALGLVLMVARQPRDALEAFREAREQFSFLDHCTSVPSEVVVNESKALVALNQPTEALDVLDAWLKRPLSRQDFRVGVGRVLVLARLGRASEARAGFRGLERKLAQMGGFAPEFVTLLDECRTQLRTILPATR